MSQQIRLTTEYLLKSRKIETVGLSRYRSFPFQTGPPNSKVCKVAPRTSCIDVGFLFAQLEESTTIFLPSSCLNREGAGQIDSEKLWNDSCNTSLAVTTAVHTVTDAHHSRFVKLDGLHQHSLCQNQTKSIAAWKIPGKLILRKTN